MPRTLAVDNASGAGRRDARGEAALSRVFEAFVGHCRLDVRFRNPYSGSGKGGVEDAVGFLRRDLMVPPMEAETRERLTRLMPAKRDGLGRSIRYRTPDPIDMMFADDVKSLRPLPSRRFDAVRWETRKADKYGYADIDGNRYQTGANMHGGRVDVAIRAARVAVKDEAGRAIAELDSRDKAKRLRLLKAAGFPADKTLENYDWTGLTMPADWGRHQPTSPDFIDRHEDPVLYGPVGTGKTHLAIAIGRAACQDKIPVRSFTVSSLVMRLRRAKRDNRLDGELAQIGKARLIILDELGYPPIDEEGSRLLFQAISDSYETRSIIYTTDIESGGWGRVFGDPNMAAAVIDRTVRHGRIIRFQGESYRSRNALMTK